MVIHLDPIQHDMACYITGADLHMRLDELELKETPPHHEMFYWGEEWSQTIDNGFYS